MGEMFITSLISETGHPLLGQVFKIQDEGWTSNNIYDVQSTLIL